MKLHMNKRYVESRQPSCFVSSSDIRSHFVVVRMIQRFHVSNTMWLRNNYWNSTIINL